MPYPLYPDDKSYKISLVTEQEFESDENTLPVLDCVEEFETFAEAKLLTEKLARKLNVPYIIKLQPWGGKKYEC
jgi:hypothetical protein